MKQETDSLKSMLKSQKDHISRISEEKDILELENLKLSKSLEDLKLNFEKQQGFYQNRLEYLESEKTKVFENNMRLTQELDELNGVGDDLKERNDKIKALQQIIEGLNNERGVLEKELAKTRQDFHEKSLKSDKKISDFEESIKRKHVHNQGLEAELTEIKRYLQEKSEETIKSTIGKERSITELEKALENQKKELEEKSVQIKILERARDDSDRAFSLSEKEKEALKLRFSSFRKAFLSLKRKIKSLSPSFEALKRDHDRLKDWVKRSLVTRFQEAYKGLSELQEKFREATLKLESKFHNRLRKTIESERRNTEEALKASRETHQAKEGSLRDEIRSLREENAKLSKEMTTLMEKVDGVTREREGLRERMEEHAKIAERSLEELEGRCSQAEKELQGSRENIEKLQESLRKAGEKEEKAFEEFQKLKRALTEMHEKHQKVYEEVSVNIETLKENQSEEVRQLSKNYEEIVETLQGQHKKSEEDKGSLTQKLQETEQQLSEVISDREYLQSQCEAIAMDSEKLKRALSRKEDETQSLNVKLKEYESVVREKERAIAMMGQEKGAKDESIKEMKRMLETIKEERTIENIKDLRDSQELSASMVRSGGGNRRQHQSPKGRKEEGNKELIRSLNELKSLGNKIGSLSLSGEKGKRKNHYSGPVKL